MIYNSDIVSIDGKTYNVGIISIEREAPVLDKYAERTEDGVLHREVIGTYYNYKIKFGNNVGSPEDYDALYEVLTSPVEFHTISAPYGNKGTHTYIGYISSVKDKVMKNYESGTLWNSLSASFIAKEPART